jgi:hypothetical protein
MASGMGMPSMAIYSYELFNFFEVDNIIRVGSIGAMADDVKLRDLIIGMGASTTSAFATQYELDGSFSAIADYKLMKTAIEESERLGVSYKVGNILSSDVFYGANPKSTEKWIKMGVLGVEMEAAALYAPNKVFFDCYTDYETCLKGVKDGNGESIYNVPCLKGKMYAYAEAQTIYDIQQKQRIPLINRTSKGNWLFDNPNYWDLDVDALQSLKDFLEQNLK